MKNMTPLLMANACGGILHRFGTGDAAGTEITAVTTDSREAGEGCLFAAIRGERVDGHSFIRDVFAKGAACVLSERDLTDEDIPAGREKPGCWIRVKSTAAALRDLAEYYLQQLGIPTVGIAGSVGKTSTKEMAASVLSRKYRVLKTQGNFNNELGVPLTIFRLRDEDEIAVLEMGISDFGEMHRLSRIVHPDIVIMTNIGECHLEYLGDRDGVLRAKSEIFDYLKEDGHIILNGNDDRLTTVRDVKGITPVFFGLPDRIPGTGDGPVQLSFYADEMQNLALEGTRARIHTPEGSFLCTIPVPGEHMVMNALAAAAAGLACRMTCDEIRQGIESYRSVGGRLNLIHSGGMTVIDDCYNANPVSMKAALNVLKGAEGRRVAVLGDMAELGPDERMYHEQIGAFAAELGIELLAAVGERGGWIAEGTGGKIPCIRYKDAGDFLENGLKELKAGDTVLLKASHCMQFEKIVNHFLL